MNRSARADASYVVRRAIFPTSGMEAALLWRVTGSVLREAPLVILDVRTFAGVPLILRPFHAVHRDDKRTELREPFEFSERPAVREIRANGVTALVRAERGDVERETVAARVAAKTRVAIEAPEMTCAALV